jgi:hypothetical protein
MVNPKITRMIIKKIKNEIEKKKMKLKENKEGIKKKM